MASSHSTDSLKGFEKRFSGGEDKFGGWLRRRGERSDVKRRADRSTNTLQNFLIRSCPVKGLSTDSHVDRA